MSFRTFDPTLRPPRAQTAYAKGRRGRLPSPAGLGNQGLVQQGQPEVRGIPKHTVTYVTPKYFSNKIFPPVRIEPGTSAIQV